MTDILRTEKFELVVAFPDDDWAVAVVCGNDILPYGEAFFRCLGCFSPNTAEGRTRFIDNLREHLARPRGWRKKIKVVVW